MSMNDNLEVKMAQLTDVVRGLSNTPKITASDLNEVLNNFVQKVESSNEDSARKLTNNVTATLTDVLEMKHNEIQERLTSFENFVSAVEKTATSPRMENEITRILNDIEAVHSKMRSSELQTENLIKSFDAMKNSSSAGQMQKLFNEVMSISRAYDGIVEVLNGNFKEFLKHVEATVSKEDFQKLAFSIQNIENGQDVLLSAMNNLNEKQEEVKTLIRNATSATSGAGIGQMQDILSRLNNIVLDTVTKSDLSLITDKLASVTTMISDMKDSSAISGHDNVFRGQLNNIIAKLDSIRFGNNPNEDIVKLYSTVAEIKDGIYSTINSKLNDVISSMEFQFDKISNTMLTSSMDSNDVTTRLASEIQKLKSDTDTNLNIKSSDIKEEVKRQAQESILTTVNAIKGEIARLTLEMSSAESRERLDNLIKTIEQLKTDFNLPDVIEKIEAVKETINFDPIKEELARLNKEELLTSIETKIDSILENKKEDEILLKLEEINNSNNLENLYKLLDAINEKIDFSGIDAKFASLKDFITNADFTTEIISIREKLGLIDNIGQGLVSVKNIDFVLSEIKNKIMDNFRLNEQKINENSALQEDIKKALNIMFETITEFPKTQDAINTRLVNEVEGRLGAIVQNVTEIHSSLPELAKENFNNLEKAAGAIITQFEAHTGKVNELLGDNHIALKERLEEIVEKLTKLDFKLENEDNEKITEIKEKIELVDEVLKTIAVNFTGENFTNLERKLVDATAVTSKETRELVVELQNSLAVNMKAIKTYIAQYQGKSITEEFIPIFDDLEARLAEKFVTIETILEEGQSGADKKLEEALNSFKTEFNTILAPLNENINRSITNITDDIVKKHKEDLMLEVSDSIKGELDGLISLLRDSRDASDKELLSKFVQVLAARETSEARVNYVKSVTETLSAILDKSSATQESMENFKDQIIELNNAIEQTEERIIDTLSKSDLIEKIQNIIQLTIAENDRFRDFDPEALISSLNGIMDENEKITERLNEEISSNIDVLAETAKSLEDVNVNINDYISQNNINNESISELIRKLENCVNENNSEYIDLLNGLKEEISLSEDRIGGMIQKIIRESIDDNAFDKIKGELNDITRSKLEKLEENLQDKIYITRNEILSAVENYRGGGNSDKLETQIRSILLDNKEQLVSLIGSFISKYDEFGGNIKDVIGAVLDNKMNTLLLTSNNELRNSIVTALNANVNEKHKDADNKLDAIANGLNYNFEDTRQKIIETKEQVARKLDEALKEFKDSAKSGNKAGSSDAKMDEIASKVASELHKIIDDKIFDIVNRNNDLIKDELRFQADTITADVTKELSNKLDKLASMKVNSDGTVSEGYSLSDLESDIAKIRMDIEKNNKITDFKEFASRLIELKNINLENSKISRAIGSDIVRFDSWLKNTSQKIDALASKFEKTDKVKIEDLKSKISQSDSPLIGSQKFEDALTSIYKKYRTQESKIDDIASKLDDMFQTHSETFDSKGFIDLLYENAKKQENLMNRMDSIEDKMDLIQAKIDHIISSCIDE